MAIEMNDYVEFLRNSDLAPGVGVSAYTFIGVGVLVVVLSFLSCWASWTGNKCMTGTMAAIMVTILIAEIGVANIISRQKVSGEKIVEDALYKGMKNYGNNATREISKTWDKIQHTFKCCGVRSPANWTSAKFNQPNKKNAPDSCCTIVTPGCGQNKLANQVFPDLFQVGCLSKFYVFVTENAMRERVDGVGTGIIIFAVLIAYYLISLIAFCHSWLLLGKEDGKGKNVI